MFGVAPYLSIIRNAFLTMLAYRMRYYTGIVTYFLFVSVHYFIWNAVFAHRPPGGELHGFSLSQMVTYVAVGWVARSLYFSDIDEQIDEFVKSGQIAILLLRPINFQLMMTCQALGESLFRVIFFSFPISLVIMSVFPVAPPPTFAAFGLFVFSTFLGFLIFSQLNFLVGLLAFFVHSIQGIVRAKYYLVQLLSGLLVPVAFFPGWVRPIIELLPFQAIAGVPLQFYLGKTDHMTWDLLSLQLAWLLALSLAGALLWRVAASKLVLQGG